MNTDTVFVAGRVTDSSNPRRLMWRLLGIFTKEADADLACVTVHDFLRPLQLEVPVERQDLWLSHLKFPRKKETK